MMLLAWCSLHGASALPVWSQVEFLGLKLAQSYNNRPCPWAQLGFWELDVASFDRIPLEGVHLVWMGLVDCIVCPCNSLLSTEKVVAAIGKCNALAYCKRVRCSLWGDRLRLG
jgi:hypothetical protein